MNAPFGTVEDVAGGRYELTRELGAGGQGTVFAARSCTTGKDVAVKRFHAAVANRPALVDRVRWLSTARLGERCSVFAAPMIALSTSSGLGYVAPLVAGRDVSTFMQTEAPPLVDAMAVATALALAVARMENELGAAHGDLSSGNVLVGRAKAGNFLVKLIDLDNVVVPGLPPPLMVGTPAYLAPELFRGESPSRTSERYALGCLIHELLLGAHPVLPLLGSNAATRELAQAVSSSPWRSAAGKPAGLPRSSIGPSLERLMQRALDGAPRDRPTAADWCVELERALDRIFECEECGLGMVNTGTRTRCVLCGARGPTYALETSSGKRVPIRMPCLTLRGRAFGVDDVSVDLSLYPSGFDLVAVDRSPTPIELDDGQRAGPMARGSRYSLRPGDQLVFGTVRLRVDAMR